MPKSVQLLIASALVAGTTLIPVARAADALDPVRVQFGVNLNIVPNLGVGFTAGASLNNLAVLAPGVSLGARADLGVTFANPVVVALGLAPVVVFAFDNGGFYVGPSVGLGLGGGNFAFGFGLKGGVEYNLSPEVMLYGNLGLNVIPSVVGNLAFGGDFELSRPLSIFAQGRVVFASGNAAFGFGAGLAYRF